MSGQMRTDHTCPRNRILPRFINKSITIEPIQGDERQPYKADKGKNKNKEDQNLPAETPKRNRVEPELHDDAPRR
jgi:hypothetical protein